jgi:prevent-host-death family protein
MTCSDYYIVMKAVGIADLKSRLSEHLRSVRLGRTLIVMDRETPVARIVPYESSDDRLVVRRPTPTAPKPNELIPPEPVKLGVDVVEILLEDRRSGR